MRGVLAGITGLLAAIAAAMLGAGMASAGPGLTVKVNSLKDPITPGPEVQCADPVPGAKCTLRAAVTFANNSPGIDTIKLPRGTIELEVEDPIAITEDAVILGKGRRDSKVMGTRESGIFEVDHGETGTAEITKVTLTGGKAFQGGAIDADSPLLVKESRITKNKSTFDGGGIFSRDNLTIQETKIDNNKVVAQGTSTAAGGGLRHYEDIDGGDLTITDSVITGNRVSLGEMGTDAAGGGLLMNGPGSISDTTISDNRAGRGAGLFVSTADGVNLDRVTISGNVGSGTVLSYGGVIISNSTLSGNESDFGVVNRQTGNLNVENSTIADNGGAIPVSTTADPGVLVVGSSILKSPANNCSGSIISVGYNVQSDNDCNFGAAGDQENADPALKPLADNGGPTLTHGLKAGSDALGAVTSGCPPPATDQRGTMRSSPCDAGSFEKP